MIEYWVEVAHVPGIVRSHTAHADDPCSAARQVLAEEYGIAKWQATPYLPDSYDTALVLYMEPLSAAVAPLAQQFRPVQHTPIKVYVHGEYTQVPR